MTQTYKLPGDATLEFVPGYAKVSAMQAIHRVMELEKNKFFRPGLYYIVLTDLSGSTEASSKIGIDENSKRIQNFIGSTIGALNQISSKNKNMFLKELGDASLLLFTNFQDVLNWSYALDRRLHSINKKYAKQRKPKIYQLFCKKCIHLGEVNFIEHSNPMALAINQIFKIEKKFQKNQIGITDAVKQVILPRINSGELKTRQISRIILPGENVRRPLWIIY